MTYLLKHIPDELWKKIKIRSIEEGVTIRVILIRGLKNYIRETPLLHEEQFDREIDNTEAQAMAKDALGAMKRD